MEILNLGTNIVIVAKTFNPSIIDKHWMITNKVVDEQEIGENCISAPMVSQIDARDFKLLVVPDQMQFIPNEISRATQDLVTSKLLAITDKLPHTPYVAIGINFFVEIAPKKHDFDALNRQLFFNSNNPIFEEFNSEDSRYGAYLSKDIFGCRLRLDIKPAKKKNDEEVLKEHFRFTFNFHKDLAKGKQTEEIKRLLQMWGEAFEYVDKLLDTFIQVEAK